jgi:uracil-DNA glycosylase
VKNGVFKILEGGFSCLWLNKFIATIQPPCNLRRYSLDNSIRLQYLEAMGIEVWMPRVSSHVEQSLSFDVETDADNAEHESSESLQTSWDTLQTEVASCTKCALCETRTQTVFGTGNKTADWMVIGEAPGQHEDEQGKPFVGKAGLLLTEMLRAVGLDRDDQYPKMQATGQS